VRGINISCSKFALLTVVLISIACAAQTAPAAPIDVRILIDVSGSMKANDPANLRVPALRLVAELMPRGAQAGIWLFSERVEPLVAVGTVDATWKTGALKVLDRIHSRGRFTDIEAALAAASEDWDTSNDAAVERHIILLTDGMVDVSQAAADSAESRSRILDEQLARIKRQGAQIHTIALSANSDKELLTTLAGATEAWAEEVESAASLQRVFLHMFEQAAKPDSIPLLDNQFEVDSSVSEMTLLVFRTEGAEPLQLRNPAGARMTAVSHDDSVRWREDSGYDLVTVTGPDAGSWQINTTPDPDNRVMIVTDLKLAISDVPAYLMADEDLTVRAFITERGERLARADFLKLLNVNMMVATVGAASSGGLPMSFDESDNAFVGERVVDWPAGSYELVVRVDGGTFRRQQRTRIRIAGAPFTFSSELVPDKPVVKLQVNAEPEIIAGDTLDGLVVVSGPDESSAVFDLPDFNANRSTLEIPVNVNGTYRIEPRIIAASRSGRIMNVRATPILADVTTGVAPPVTEDVPMESQSAPAIDWLRSGLMVLLGNVALLCILGVVWLAIGQRKKISAKAVTLQ